MPEHQRASAYYLSGQAGATGARVSASPRQPKPLYGAAAIAEYLKLPKAKQVYRLFEAHKGDIPIRKVVGMGLATDEDALAEWWDRVIIRGEG